VTTVHESEARRIREEYARRAREIPADRYSPTNLVNRFFVEQRIRRALGVLRACNMLPVAGRKALEVGCGARGWLRELEDWGASRSDLHGIDLDAERVSACRRLLGAVTAEDGTILSRGADIREGDACELPWDDGSFDIVIQSTMMTSILDARVRSRVAGEMFRTLRPDGVILWYDFAFNNPRNPHVRGIGRREIATLFPRCELRLERVTLAPPLARAVVPWSWPGATFLEGLRVLNSHLIGAIIPKRDGRSHA
jgi:SAM-dependent methyltransferase